MYAYLGAVSLLSIGAIATMSVLFLSGYPAFVSSLFAGPTDAVWANPVNLLLLVATLALIVLLVALIVVVGAEHAPDPDDSGRNGD